MQSGFGQGGQPPGYPPGYPSGQPGGNPPGWGQQPAPATQPQQPAGYGAPAPQPYGAPPAPGYGAPPQPDPMGYGQGPTPGAASPGYGMPGAGPGAMPTSGGAYEFSEAENQIISKMASRLTTAGIVQIIVGALGLLGNFFAGVAMGIIQAPISIALVVVGALFCTAAGSFKQITRTQGNDLGHLMQAIEKLSNAALIQVIAYAIAVVLFIVIVVLVMFVFAALFGIAAMSR